MPNPKEIAIMPQLPWSCPLIVVGLVFPWTSASQADQGTPGKSKDAAWVSLFNGKDLTGWETCLGVPSGEKQPIGRNRDPKHVFQVVQLDDEPTIRISGEIFGGLATLKEYGDYHLELEFKWGEKRFAPRADLPRDSGLLYHGVNGYNDGTGWLESLEFGILEGGETGDFWSVPGAHGMRVMVDVEGVDIPPQKRRYPDEPIRHRPGGKKYAGTTAGILNSDDNEKPRGQWNKLELFCVGQNSVHMVNGTVNMVLTNARRKLNGREEALNRGRIQLQSEGAEVYFRRIRLRPIREFPPEVQRAMKQSFPNILTDQEKADGWRLLFDGESTKGWRGYRENEVPAGWQARDGALTRVAKARDLITLEKFDNFELLIDWKISHGGNSGIFYRATEETEVIYQNAPEYEIRDNAFWRDDPYTSAACYALYPPKKDVTGPVGYWNRARIVARGTHVEHWLNGEQVVTYDINSPDWKKRAKASKYHGRFPSYGQANQGHIGVQDHGDLVWYRNVKIRPLKEKE
jgi:hypothetical protein